MNEPAVLIVPGLRDAVDEHWQTHLAGRLARQGRVVRTVPPMGRENLDCPERVKAIEREAQAIGVPFVIVAHSAGTIMVAHWAMRTVRPVLGALLATPPDFETPMPAGYPTLDALRGGGWLPVPRRPLPFLTVVAASRNDPLANYERVQQLARDWDADLLDLGEVGHLNPASGFGHWDKAEELVDGIARAHDIAAAQYWAEPL
jgi:predicted alpha/beta hydrolase family esterase